jgi:hypothetical protein
MESAVFNEDNIIVSEDAPITDETTPQDIQNIFDKDEVIERTIEEEIEAVHCLESDKQITQQPESGESNVVPQEIAEKESNPIIDEPQMENDDRELVADKEASDDDIQIIDSDDDSDERLELPVEPKEEPTAVIEEPCVIKHAYVTTDNDASEPQSKFLSIFPLKRRLLR